MTRSEFTANIQLANKPAQAIGAGSQFTRPGIIRTYKRAGIVARIVQAIKG